MSHGPSPLDLPCCQTIIKAFERSAAYATTEEATFALMTGPLSNMRTSAVAFIQHEDSVEASSAPPTTEQKASLITANASKSINLKNLDKASDDDEGFFEQVRDNFTENQVAGTGNFIDADSFGGIFNSECIPCGQRLNALGELNANMLKDYGKQWIEMWKEALRNFLQQLQQLLNVFNNLDKFVDLCALLKFLKDFVCIPDLQRILSVLMALMSRMSFEMGGIWDLIQGLIGPLLSPFLSGLVDLLMKYLLLVVRPIECIIEALQGIIRKLDYNILFDNIDTLDKKNKPKRRKADSRGPIKIPFTDSFIERRDIVEGEGVLDTAANAGNQGFNSTTAALGGNAIRARKAREQAAIDQAAKELRILTSSAGNVDMADANSTEKYKIKRRAAIDKYNKAVQERDTKNIAQDLFQAKSALDSASNTVQSIKGALFQLVAQLREAIEAVEAFVADLVGEFRKIMGEYVGGSSGMVAQIIKKQGLVQMMGLISSIISAFQRGDLGCDDDKDDIRPESIIPIQQGIQIWTDDIGNIHIEQDPDDIDRAIQVAVESIGAQAQTRDGPKNAKEADRGENADTPGQKLKKLVEFTGDPVLDTEIARTTEALITPVRAVFRCPLQTSVAQAEQINQWIQSLNS